MISDTDARKGGAPCQVWLPAGEVYFAPVPGTAEGTVVFDPFSYQGLPVEQLTLSFSVAAHGFTHNRAHILQGFRLWSGHNPSNRER